MGDLLKMLAIRDAPDITQQKHAGVLDERGYLSQLLDRRLATIHKLQQRMPELSIGDGYHAQGEIFLHVCPSQLLPELEILLQKEPNLGARIALVVPYETDEEPQVQ